MSGTSDQQSADIASSSGISAELAGLARQAILEARIPPTDGRPATFIAHQDQTRRASNAFLVHGDKATLAQLLGINVKEAEVAEKVRGRFRGSQAGFFNTTPREIKPGRTDLIYTILALGDLSIENGLPVLGSSKAAYSLKSGEALHFKGDLEQIYSDGGGGTLIWFEWDALP